MSRESARPAALLGALLGTVALAAALASGCGPVPAIELPAPLSEPPDAQGILRAGLGRADITPPPGLGLSGWGPEGRRARGYRHRLYARAMLLEDAAGERLALVALDLGQLSLLLHRRVAREIVAETGIGADRLIMGVTHTHAAVGHFFGARAYNEYGSMVPGFERAVVAFLAERIAAAVIAAAADLRPARLAWGTRNVWGLTRNRSLEPYLENPAEWQDRFRPPPGVPDELGRVDPRMTLLRIDLLETDAGGASRFRPAGAMSVFAIHGTGNPFANQLYDGDIHAFLERRLEHHVDSLNARPGGRVPIAVHLTLNGAEGDVAPNLPEATRSRPPILVRELRPGGPRSPIGRERWTLPPPAEQAERLAAARAGIRRLGTALGDHAVALFDSLGDQLSDAVSIRRAFAAVPLVASVELGLCEPRTGTSSVGGTEDGRTRFWRWNAFHLQPVGFEEGGSAVFKPRKGCHAAKELLLGPFYRLFADQGSLPAVAQLTVARIGDRVLGAIPFEATTITGARIRDAMAAGADPADPSTDRAVLIGLANGYAGYVATAEEYDRQHYEGGSTLYGPRTAEVLTQLMGALASRLPAPGQPSPPAALPPDTVFPGPARRLLPSRTAGPPPEEIERALSTRWRRDTLFIRWNDVHPGRLVPADGPVLEIQARAPDGSWQRRTWDDDADLEVWAIGPAGRRGYQWEARWSPATAPVGEHRVVILARPGFPAVVGAAIRRR